MIPAGTQLCFNVPNHLRFDCNVVQPFCNVAATLHLQQKNSYYYTKLQLHCTWSVTVTSRTRHRTFKTHQGTIRQGHQLHRKMECRSLCLNIQMWLMKEKYVIARADHKTLLKKRTELIPKCCNRNKYILRNIK